MADKDNQKPGQKSAMAETSAAASVPASETGVRADAVPSEPVVQVRKVKFAVEQKSPTLELGHGEYSRKFNTADQPFECADDEEFAMLIGSGLFVEA